MGGGGEPDNREGRTCTLVQLGGRMTNCELVNSEFLTGLGRRLVSRCLASELLDALYHAVSQLQE